MMPTSATFSKNGLEIYGHEIVEAHRIVPCFSLGIILKNLFFIAVPKISEPLFI
jgi:hypothetical protein